MRRKLNSACLILSREAASQSHNLVSCKIGARN